MHLIEDDLDHPRICAHRTRIVKAATVDRMRIPTL
ncbi:MAG: hypothetical protein RIR25_680, partial [Verrucomicrobiota bacterium]